MKRNTVNVLVKPVVCLAYNMYYGYIHLKKNPHVLVLHIVSPLKYILPFVNLQKCEYTGHIDKLPNY